MIMSSIRLAGLHIVFLISVVVAQAPVSPVCNQGWEFAAFTNTQGMNSDSYYQNFNPAYTKGTSAGGDGIYDMLFSNITKTIGGFSNSCSGNPSLPVYGTANSVPCTFFTLSHRGYLFAALGGTYTVNLTNTDDIALVWTGKTAQSGWTRGNAILTSTYGLPSSGTLGHNATTFTLTQGQYFPMRVIFGQAQGGVGFSLQIKNPLGVSVFDQNHADPNYIISSSCCDQTAPYFPYEFGYEQ